MTIDSAEFFQKFLDPHKTDVAEWGAEAGFWGLSRSAGLQRVVKLVESAISQAGFGQSAKPKYLGERLERIGDVKKAVLNRINAGIGRLTGANGFSSRSWVQRFFECLFDIASIAFLPFVFGAALMLEAMTRRSFNRLDEGQKGIDVLRRGAEAYLTVWFESHADRGELASRIKRRAIIWPSNAEPTYARTPPPPGEPDWDM